MTELSNIRLVRVKTPKKLNYNLQHKDLYPGYEML